MRYIIGYVTGWGKSYYWTTGIAWQSYRSWATEYLSRAEADKALVRIQAEGGGSLAEVYETPTETA